MSKIFLTKSIWLLFYISLLALIFDNALEFFPPHPRLSSVLYHIQFILPVVIVILHAYVTLSFFRGALFLILASTIGTYMEILGLSNGVIFGGYYEYASNLPTLLNVPISVICYWAVFIYSGYTITNSFTTWLSKMKPHVSESKLWNIVPLVLADVVTVVAIDLIMDPVQVHKGTWTWLNGGVYFGVPIGNFIGWALVVAIVTGIYRTFEFFVPQKVNFDSSLYVISVFAYAMLAISFTLQALSYNLFWVACIGGVLMSTIICLNLALYKSWRQAKTSYQ